jgi:hypothetical protein
MISSRGKSTYIKDVKIAMTSRLMGLKEVLRVFSLKKESK